MSKRTDSQDSVLGAKAPTRRPRNIAADRAAYAVARLLIIFLRMLPWSWARALGRGTGRMIWRMSARYRKQILRHMEIAFRDTVSREQKETWCRQNFEHVGLSVVEFARINQLTRDNMTQWVNTDALVKVVNEQIAKRGGKGVLIIPAHHGNWEWGGYTAALAGLPLQSVARPLDNPQLNEMITTMRETSGNVIIPKWNVLWTLKKLLDRGQAVTMSVDQNGGVAGVFVPMFGALASTVASPAELHFVSKAPIIVTSLNREADGIHHTFKVWDVIEFDGRPKDHAAGLKHLLARINRAYEKAVRAYPEQWLWVHRRWKTRPPGEVPGSDGLPPIIDGWNE